MKRLLLILLICAGFVGALAAYLILTTPRQPALARLPVSASQRQLMASVPASADVFAFIPSAAAFHAHLRSNPAARPHVDRWGESQAIPPPWVLGKSDLVAWRSGDQLAYAVQLDSLRAMLLRAYLTLSGDAQGTFNGRVFVVNADRIPAAASDASEVDALLKMAEALPRGHALLFQREGERNLIFPPIDRPTVSTIHVAEERIVIASRSSGAEGAAEVRRPLPLRFPRSALITVAFSSPPRILGDLDRLVQSRITTLLRDGGMIALYEVDTDKLLPRPREVIVLPATPERRQQLREFIDDLAPSAVRQVLGFRIETADTGTELLVAFERETIDRYLRDTFGSAMVSGTEWTLRTDPQQLVPVLGRIGDSTALRLATPRLFRSARQMQRWIGQLEGIRSVEAASSLTPAGEELTVVLSSK